MSRRRGGVLVVLAATLILPLPVDGQALYWGTDRGEIYRAAPDGSGAELLFRADRGVSAIELDLVAGRIYWAEWLTGRIRRARLDGSAVETVVGAGVQRFAIDTPAGKVYWTGHLTSSGAAAGVFRANLNGTSVEQVVSVEGSPGAIALDVQAGKMYWFERGPYTKSLRRANLDGSDVDDLIAGVSGQLALDVAAGKTYFTRDDETRSIDRCDIDGTDCETLVEESLGPRGIVVDHQAGKIYWTVRGADGSAGLRRGNVDGTNVENLIRVAPGATAPWGIALDPTCRTPGPDCQPNGRPDFCDIVRGFSRDCDRSGVPDECEVTDGTSPDCNANGVPDQCEPGADCNGNGRQDICDLYDRRSFDCNGNLIPDECEPQEDCNRNGVQDICDLGLGRSEDCDENGVPDDCQVDCNANGIADVCELECTGNGVPDDCDIAAGTSLDRDGNGIPDECDLDCNENGMPDVWDIATGTSPDVDGGGVPDECETYSACQAGDGLFDYQPHRANFAAEQLAIQFSGDLRAPDYLYRRMARDLKLIRLTFPESQSVGYSETYAANKLEVRLRQGADRTSYDALNRLFQVIEDRQISMLDPMLRVLIFCDSINASVLADLYGALNEVEWVSPAYRIILFPGSDSGISVNDVIGDLEYHLFTYFDGCGEAWTVRTNSAGVLRLIEFVTYGGCACGYCTDCNQNRVEDACDLDCGAPLGECDVPRCGRSADCNANGVPDECDVIGDLSGDGRVDLGDHRAFASDLFGPSTPTRCSLGDFDADGDADLRDFAAFQLALANGPPATRAAK